MKLLLLTLLLSAQVFAQNNIYYNSKVAIGNDTFPYERIVPVGAMEIPTTKNNPLSNSIKRDADGVLWVKIHGNWQLLFPPEHTHKWVELHQDTVRINFMPLTRNELLFPEYRQLTINGEYIDYETHLICLICREEKKKVIHYKRDSPYTIEVKPTEEDKERIRKRKEEIKKGKTTDIPL